MEYKVTTRRSKAKTARQLYLTRRYFKIIPQKENKDKQYNRQLDQECETCMNYQIGKCYQICHIMAHMGSDMVVATIGILASHNILEHPLASLIRIHCKHWGSYQ
jgi:hypothetical protein